MFSFPLLCHFLKKKQGKMIVRQCLNMGFLMQLSLYHFPYQFLKKMRFLAAPGLHALKEYVSSTFYHILWFSGHFGNNPVRFCEWSYGFFFLKVFKLIIDLLYDFNGSC
jgi:hypothetical protein